MKELDFDFVFIKPTSFSVTSNVDPHLYNQAVKLRDDYRKISAEIIQMEASIGDIKDEIKTVEDLITKLNSVHSEFATVTATVIEKYTKIHNFQEMNEKLGTLRHERDRMLSIINLFCTNERSLCALCFERDFSLFFMPCGHTACVECTSKIRNGSCPFCRSSISERKSIFIE